MNRNDKIFLILSIAVILVVIGVAVTITLAGRSQGTVVVVLSYRGALFYATNSLSQNGCLDSLWIRDKNNTETSMVYDVNTIGNLKAKYPELCDIVNGVRFFRVGIPDTGAVIT